jgi:putative chitinase
MSFEFDFTAEKLGRIIPNAAYGVDVWFNELNEMLPVFEVTSVARVAAFVAQTAHESGGYRALVENLNYAGDRLPAIWPKHFTGVDLSKYSRNPQAIANRAYRSRMGNGDEASGDGWKYRGRGLIQLTGKDNYTRFGEYAEISAEDAAEYLETPRGAVHSACWFWYANDLNTYADAGDFVGMTKRINGGTIGLDDRIKHFNEAVHIFGG